MNASPKTFSGSNDFEDYSTPEARKHLSETNRGLEILLFGTSIDPNCRLSAAIIKHHEATAPTPTHEDHLPFDVRFGLTK